MDVSDLAETRQHEIQYLLIVLDQLGKILEQVETYIIL